MTNAAIYCRVSTDEQRKKNLSLDAQEAKCRQYAEDMGYDVVFTGIEGKSGKDTDRLELQRILSLVNKKTIQNILTVKLCRLSRDVEDSCRMGKSFAKKGVVLHLVTEGGPVDLSDPSQEMLFVMRSAMGQFERKRISMNTKFALARKREKGERISLKAPYGYKFVDNKVIVNPAEQHVIARIRHLNAEGYSERKLIAQLEIEGIFNRQGNKFTRPAVRNILTKAA
jgi:site-specific DNA recombinase